MKRPAISKFLNTDEWRVAAGRGQLLALRKPARFLALEALPGESSNEGLFDLKFDLRLAVDRFRDQYDSAIAGQAIRIGFGFDAELGEFISTDVVNLTGAFKVRFRVKDPNEFWLRVIGLAALGALDQLEVGLLPGAWSQEAGRYCLLQPELLCVQFLPPPAEALSIPGMEPIRDWEQRIASGQPEKTERYEIVTDCLRDLPAPKPEADPDQVLLEAMRELTAALKENTFELRCLQGKPEETAH